MIGFSRKFTKYDRLIKINSTKKRQLKKLFFCVIYSLIPFDFNALKAITNLSFSSEVKDLKI